MPQFLCKTEAPESMHRLRLLAAADDRLIEKNRRLWQEAKELSLIFASILRSSKSD